MFSKKSLGYFSLLQHLTIVEQPITYFVSQGKSQEKVNEELVAKINKNKKYGVKRINVHCIGQQNIDKINEFVEIIKTREDVKIVSLIVEGNRASLVLEINQI